MKEEHFYAVSKVAGGAIFLLAAAMIWVSLSAPERDSGTLIWGIALLVVSPFFVVEGIRIKPLPVRPWFKWLMLAASLIGFFAVFHQLRVVAAEPFGLAEIFKWLIYVVLAVYFLCLAIAKGRDTHSIQE